MKLGAVGGSVTWGCGVKRGHDEYLAQLTTWLQKAFPEASVSSRNGATPATTSAFMNLCYQNKVDADVDLLLVRVGGWVGLARLIKNKISTPSQRSAPRYRLLHLV